MISKAKALCRTAARAAANLAFPEGSRAWVLAGPGRGQRYVVTPANHLTPMLCRRERFVFKALAYFLEADTTAYDIGANEGHHSCFMALRSRRGKVFAFEPLKENMAVLARNAELNQCARQIIPLDLAVSDKVGTTEFFLGGTSCEGHLAESDFGEEEHGSRTVQTVTLDHFVYEQGNEAPSLIKIDIEGAGGLALAGAAKLLAEKRPALVLESHTRDESQAMGRILAEHNYVGYTNKGALWDHSSFALLTACWPAELDHATNFQIRK